MADDLRTFTIEEARRIALAAQGFAEPRPTTREVNTTDFGRVLRRLNIIQIDSVNVLVRAQYMPFFSRLGVYPVELLHRYAYEERNLFEYSVHEASLIPMHHLPMIRHRMAEFQPWRRWSEIMAEHPGLTEAIVDEITNRGPLAVADIENKGERYGYWATSTAKLVLETMLHQGVLAVSDRINSARRYDLSERVLPPEVALIRPVPKIDANRMMMQVFDRITRHRHGCRLRRLLPHQPYGGRKGDQQSR